MDGIVLVVSQPQDLHALGVISLLRGTYGVPVYHLDMQAFPRSASASYTTSSGAGAAGRSGAGAERRRWEGRDNSGPLDLDRVQSVWWRRPQGAEVTRLFTGVDHGEFVQTECDHFLQGLLWSRRCLWVNDPMNNLRASRKIVQLSRARDAGLVVPTTLITNDPVKARDFVDGLGGRAIFKRTGAGPGPASKTRFVTADVVRRLDSIVDCPTTFQSYVEAALDLRVVWIDGESWAVSIDSQSGSSPEDSRFDNSVAFHPYDLPRSVADRLTDLMSDLGLVYGAIDLRLGVDGEYYFLEVNPAGQFVYLELKTGLPIMSAVASVLARGTRLDSLTHAAATQAPPVTTTGEIAAS